MSPYVKMPRSCMHFPVTNSPTNPFAPAPLEIVRNFPTQILRDRRGEERAKRKDKEENLESRHGDQTTTVKLAPFTLMTWRLKRQLSEDPY